MKIRFILIFFLGISALTSAQVIPSSLRVDWSKAGFSGTFPSPSRIINVMNLGALGNGINDDYPAIADALDSLNGIAGVIYFPPGQYRITSPVELTDSIIIRGAVSDSSILLFDFQGAAENCISISKDQNNLFYPLTSTSFKNSQKLTVSNASIFSPGDHIEIRQENGSWDINPANWAAYSVGQLVKVLSISGDTLTISPSVRTDFDTALQAEIRKIVPVSHCGIECIGIQRLDSASAGANIAFVYADQCRVMGIESNKSVGSHIVITSSSHIEVKGSYFHDAYEYDGVSMHGYGVTIDHHSGECLVTNNIFQHLRHAMMVKTGANGNVFSYNNSLDVIRTETPTDLSGDISLHGHYAFANLFEGNIVQNIIIDHYWGPAGPFNTFFRNRAELYGIIMTTSSLETESQNFVGNETTNTGLLMGQYYLTGGNHFQYGNNIKGTITPGGTGNLNDTSYYLSSQPLFWHNYISWPPVGLPASLNSGTIPAKHRYLYGNTKTVCGDNDSIPASINIPDNIYNSIHIFPNPCNDKFYIRGLMGEPFEVRLFDFKGSLISFFPAMKGEIAEFHLPQNISNGIYFIMISTNDETHFRKLIVTAAQH